MSVNSPDLLCYLVRAQRMAQVLVFACSSNEMEIYVRDAFGQILDEIVTEMQTRSQLSKSLKPGRRPSMPTDLSSRHVSVFKSEETPAGAAPRSN